MDEEERNYCTLMLLISRVGLPKLRDLFIKEWNFRKTFRTWTDCRRNGSDLRTIFKSSLLPHETIKLQTGDTNRWDLLLFVKILLNSKPSFVDMPNKALVDGLQCLRETRNKLCHTPNGRIKSSEFHQLYSSACNALLLIGASKNDFEKVEEDVQQKPWNEILSLVKECSAHDSDIMQTLQKIRITTEETQESLLHGLLEIKDGQSHLHLDLRKRQSDIRKRQSDLKNEILEAINNLNVKDQPRASKPSELPRDVFPTKQPINPSAQDKPAVEEIELAARAKDGNINRKPEATFYAFDRSHSMTSMGDAPSEALFEETKHKIADAKDGDYVYIQTFDDRIDPPLYDGPASKMKLTLKAIKERLSPRGKTALNDAFAVLLKEAIKFRETHPVHEVAAVIYTDGIENSSKHYGGSVGFRELISLVEFAREDMRIHVVFLAAHIDAIETGNSYGVPQGSCLQAGEGNFDGLHFTHDIIRTMSFGRSNSFEFTPRQRIASNASIDEKRNSLKMTDASRKSRKSKQYTTGSSGADLPGDAKEAKDDIAQRKPEATFYAFDRSGSMASMGDAPTDALFKEMTTKLAEARDGDYVCIQTFDDLIDPPLYEGTVSEIKLTFEEIKKGLKPRNMTALNDAFADLLKKAIKFREANPGHEVAVVVYTDGMENSSKQYGGSEGLSKVSDLVHKSRDMGIEVIFMAANIDAFATGSSYGVPQSHCLQAGHGNFMGLQFASEGIRKKNIGRSNRVGFTNKQRYQSSLPSLDKC